MSLFDISDRAKQYQSDLLEFMDSQVYPAEAIYDEQMRAAGDPHFHPPILEELKAAARNRGLWKLFHPHPEWGPGLTNLEYAPLAEILGRSHIASEACNCSAPDTGNMEVLTLFGTDEHQQRYLKPLLEGKIRSAFAITEPAVASSDATNVEMSMVRDGDSYILNGRKWFASNGMHRNCKVLIVMGKTDPTAPVHRQQSMMVVPIDAPGLTVQRTCPSLATRTAKDVPKSTSSTYRCRSKTCSRAKARDLPSARPGWAPAAFITACARSAWRSGRWS